MTEYTNNLHWQSKASLNLCQTIDVIAIHSIISLLTCFSWFICASKENIVNIKTANCIGINNIVQCKLMIFHLLFYVEDSAA